VVIFVFPEAQILDFTGPWEVFNAASRLLEMEKASERGYAAELVGPRGGRIRTSGGIEIVAESGLSALRGSIDTLVVAGGVGARRAAADERIVAALGRAAGRARRVASVCTGAYLLAEAGLLDGRRATTHWAACDDLARRYPRIEVAEDPIFVKDGNVYSSAGVTAGMDLALALVEEDLGRDIALSVARWLVMFLKRPGGQSQFSAQLASQSAERKPIRDVQTWIVDHLDENLPVEGLAARAGMSPRNFARQFAREVGTTPARYVEVARVELARRRLEESGRGVEEIAAVCGFGSAETMRRAFLRNVRVAPADYRSRFQINR
jgi:transcriptional regulator GlxA family with amidase domain